MAKKQPAKRKFDWMTYSKPVRLLTPAQEAAFESGILSPLLARADTTPDLRFEIRARSASLYFRGASVLRLSGEGPFLAEFDVSYQQPHAQRNGERLERHEVSDEAGVSSCIGLLTELCDAIESEWDPAVDFHDRTARQRFADANSGMDLFADEYVVVDLDYTYGQRRYDLLALERTEGVTGPGGFANCRLAFLDVCRSPKGLSGNSGPASVGSDLADFAKSVGGMHFARARAEIQDLVAQKVRLGLLPRDIELRGLDESGPSLVVVFGSEYVEEAVYGPAIIELHEKLAARHFATDHLGFAHVGDIERAAAQALTVHEGDVMSYRAFKTYRKAGGA